MRLITCPKCNSQFDVSSMTAGTSFVCGQCRNVLEVPQAGPVVQPVKRGGGDRGRAAPPPTVNMSPDQMRDALQASKDVGETPQPTAPRKAAAQRRARARMEPPPTVAMSPDQMQQALRGAAGGGGAGAPAKLPKAMQRRAQQAGGPQRAGGAQQPAQPAQPAKKRSRAARTAAATTAGGGRRAPRPQREPKKQNPALVIGIVGGVLVLGVAGFFLFGGGGSGETSPGDTPDTAGGATDPSSNGTSPDTAAGTGADSGTDTGSATGTETGAGGTAATTGTDAGTTANVQLDEIGKFLALAPQAQKDDVTRRLMAARGSLEKLEVLHTWLTQERLTVSAEARTGATKVGTEALRIDANCAWANEAAGKHDLKALLKGCIDECIQAFQFADDDENAIQERMAEIGDGTAWVADADWQKFDKLVKAVRKRNEELATDPRLVQVEEHRDWIRKNDLFKDLNIIARHDDPYIIFQQYPDLSEGLKHYTPDRIRKANLFAKRDGIVFRELNKRFRELFAERFKLPELREHNRLLRVLVLWNRETFDEWHRRQNTGIPGLVRAYYSPLEKHIVHYVGDDALTEQDIIKCANGRVQKRSDQVTAHEGTHQLHHEYGAIFRGTPLSDGLDIPLNRKSMWFGEGLAEFMGSVEVDAEEVRTLEGATFHHNRLLLSRINFSRSMRRNRVPLWSLADLLLPNNNQELVQKGNELVPGQGGQMANQFYAQSWALTHFLWYYDGGKYRNAYLEFMERVFKHEHGPEAFAKAIGVPSASDFGEVDKEFEWYWRQLLKRKVGREHVGGGQLGKWFFPETETPTGRYEPEEDSDDDDYDTGDDDEEEEEKDD